MTQNKFIKEETQRMVELYSNKYYHGDGFPLHEHRAIRFAVKNARSTLSQPTGDVAEMLAEALRSIANNTCCGNCQEAALVAKKALAAYEAGREDRRSETPTPPDEGLNTYGFDRYVNGVKMAEGAIVTASNINEAVKKAVLLFSDAPQSVFILRTALRHTTKEA